MKLDAGLNVKQGRDFHMRLCHEGEVSAFSVVLSVYMIIWDWRQGDRIANAFKETSEPFCFFCSLCSRNILRLC